MSATPVHGSGAAMWTCRSQTLRSGSTCGHLLNSTMPSCFRYRNMRASCRHRSFIMPAIDAFSIKNAEMSKAQVRNRLEHYHIPDDRPMVADLAFRPLERSRRSGRSISNGAKEKRRRPWFCSATWRPTIPKARRSSNHCSDIKAIASISSPWRIAPSSMPYSATRRSSKNLGNIVRQVQLILVTVAPTVLCSPICQHSGLRDLMVFKEQQLSVIEQIRSCNRSLAIIELGKGHLAVRINALTFKPTSIDTYKAFTGGVARDRFLVFLPRSVGKLAGRPAPKIFSSTAIT